MNGNKIMSAIRDHTHIEQRIKITISQKNLFFWVNFIEKT